MPYRNRLAIFFILLSMSLLAGCTGMTLKKFQAMPVQNWLYLHADPQVGDFALFNSLDKSRLTKMEVVGLNPKTVEVAVSWPRAPMAAAFLQEISYHFFVSYDGTVQYAHMLDLNGNVRPLRVARPGDFNYIAPMDTLPLPAPETIETLAGRFQVREVYVFNQRLSNLGLRSKVTSVFFVAPSVHFGLVRQAHVLESRLPLAEVVELIDENSPAPKPYASLMDLINERSEGQQYLSGMDLVQTN